MPKNTKVSIAGNLWFDESEAITLAEISFDLTNCLK